MIRSIELVNWRSHSKSEFVFQKGTNFLVGIMGSGKSSVMDGLCYAFFGTFPALKRGKVTLKDVLMHNCGEDAKIAVSFDFEKVSYKVVRVISQKGVTLDAELFEEGRIIEKTPRAVTSRICSILRVDYDLFTRAIYSEQNRVDYFLSLDPRKRKVEIDELLGLDRFEHARSSVTTVINRLGDAKSSIEGNFSQKDLEELHASKKKADEGNAKAVEQIKVLQSSLAVCSRELKEYQKSFELENSRKSEHERISSSVSRMEGELRATLSQTEGAKKEEIDAKLQQAELTLVASKKELEEKKSLLFSLDREISKVSSNVGFLKAQQERASKIKSDLEKKKAEFKAIEGPENMATVENRIATLNNELEDHLKLQATAKSLGQEAQNAIASISGTEAMCPVCAKPLAEGESQHIKEEKQQVIESSKKLLEEAVSKAAEASKQSKESQSKLNSLKMALQAISSLESELGSLGSQQSKLSEEQSLLEIKQQQKIELDAKAAQLQKSISELALSNSKLSTQKQLIDKKASLEAQLADFRRALLGLGFKAGAAEASRDRLEKARVDIARLESSLALASKNRESMEQLASQLGQDVQKMDKMRLEIGDFEYRLEQSAIIKNALATTQLAIRNEYIAAVNLALEEIWQIIYPYGDIKKVRLSVDEKDYYFEVFDTQWRDLDASASGGERACLALSLRIAFATVLTPNLSWIILDEPTHNLDSDAVRALAYALQEKIPLLVEQVFVITHDSALVEAGVGKVYRLARNKDKNEATAIATE